MAWVDLQHVRGSCNRPTWVREGQGRSSSAQVWIKLVRCDWDRTGAGQSWPEVVGIAWCRVETGLMRSGSV